MPLRPCRPIVSAEAAGSRDNTRIVLRRTARVLFAFDEGTRSRWSLRRAMALARALDSELHAIFVAALEASGGASAGQPELAAREWTKDEAYSARAWLVESLGAEGEADALFTRWGDFAEQVAAHARAIDASMIVVPTQHGTGEVTTTLAHAAGVPVLVARDRAAGDTIVAATDLEDCSYPVLRAATQLSRRLGVPLIALHNLSPISVLNAMDLVLSEPRRRPVRTLIDLQRNRLHCAVRELPGSATPIVAEEVDPVEAILREARGGGVDLVAVGARKETWWGRWLRRSVTVRVVERAPCSVLVVPITEMGDPGELSLARA
jgi:nucleotide-binding universal stress UspA family protein